MSSVRAERGCSVVVVMAMVMMEMDGDSAQVVHNEWAEPRQVLMQAARLHSTAALWEEGTRHKVQGKEGSIATGTFPCATPSSNLEFGQDLRSCATIQHPQPPGW